jgi:hypothetical protein
VEVEHRYTSLSVPSDRRESRNPNRCNHSEAARVEKCCGWKLKEEQEDGFFFQVMVFMLKFAQNWIRKSMEEDPDERKGSNKFGKHYFQRKKTH